MRNIEWLYEGEEKTPLDFYFDLLSAPNLSDLIPEFEIDRIYSTIRDPKLSCRFNEKERKVTDILSRYGFYKYHAGTNRNIYAHYEYTNILIKVAMDKKCLTDNIWEFKNQFKFAPFVPKMFEVDHKGVIGLMEKVIPIKSREEFIMLADDIFDMLLEKFIGQYVLDDIGTEAFMNYGYRDGFGPVLLDFPYAYELDGNKLTCSKVVRGHICNGVIDYDDGFNKLVCNRCGTKYSATELQAKIKNDEIKIVKPKGDSEMIIKFRRGKNIVGVVDTTNEVSNYTTQSKRKKRFLSYTPTKAYDDGETFIIKCTRGDKVITGNEPINQVDIQEEIKEEVAQQEQPKEEVIKISEEQVEVVEESYPPDPFEGWSEEEIAVYKQAKVSLEATKKGLMLTEDGYNKQLELYSKYPIVYESIFLELGINGIPTPEIVEETSKEVDVNEQYTDDNKPVEKDSGEDIIINKKKSASEIAREYKEKTKPKLKIYPRIQNLDDDDNIEDYY